MNWQDIASLKEYDRIINMTFSSETEAFKFFNAYAKRKGFSVRKSIIKRDKTNGAIKFRRFYCSRHGFREKKHIDKPNRKRQHKLLTRCGCPVKFCVKLDKRTGMWWVQDFNDCHNHDLAAVDTAPFLRSHCFISEAQKLEISSKRASGIRNCQILDYDARCRGGYQNRGYQEKNLYNFSTVHERSSFLEDDADSIIRAIQQFERCLMRMRTKEAKLDCIAFQKEPVLQTPFLDLEKSAVCNYTTKVFYIVQK
ncbi:FAR1-related sequence 10 [Rhynchospora pubera]|uniref:FAR1-related sequence 10 n=1 Tax=Rhynchospora pubera TaxID=906938 RepID=A0AAV8DFF2_9POAL|nr:FAR1-related sequence 10 [Rhynchospora pubera]